MRKLHLSLGLRFLVFVLICFLKGDIIPRTLQIYKGSDSYNNLDMIKINSFDSFLECLHHRGIYSNVSKIVKGQEQRPVQSSGNPPVALLASIGGRNLIDMNTVRFSYLSFEQI